MYTHLSTSILRMHEDKSLTGVLLIMASIMALIISNTDLVSYYQHFLHIHIKLSVAHFHYDSTLHHFINDGLMAIFFFHIGLELKHEMISGNLNTIKKSILPFAGALGGMIFPAAIYLYFNFDNPVSYRGWAIPTATDIAFAIGIMALVGKQVPHALKVFLTALAVFDDLGAILIIAIFYSTSLSPAMLVGAGVITAILFFMNKSGIESVTPYLLVSVVLWVFVLHSGIHATITGVVSALSIPLINKVKEQKHGEHDNTNLINLYDKIYPHVSYLILPLFAFANAGVTLTDVQITSLFSPVLYGITLGLCIGKPLGITLLSYIGCRLNVAKLDPSLNWSLIFAASIICGIGFTMSLFIGDLAFVSYKNSLYPTWVKSGVLLGSFTTSVIGYITLKMCINRKPLSIEA